MAISLLPTEDIVTTWEELKNQDIPNMGNPVDKHFRKFKRYVERTWIQEKLEFLSVYESPHRTNNSVESYNARWNQRFGVKHPNFWELVTAMCEVSK